MAEQSTSAECPRTRSRSRIENMNNVWYVFHATAGYRPDPFVSWGNALLSLGRRGRGNQRLIRLHQPALEEHPKKAGIEVDAPCCLLMFKNIDKNSGPKWGMCFQPTLTLFPHLDKFFENCTLGTHFGSEKDPKKGSEEIAMHSPKKVKNFLNQADK